ncbi:NAD(+)/NADH kinase [Actinocrispum wychmicini]|uniref:NAD kinase n=1 Tax=Actinocrispum wychmicini TaxID=1213861 RepID=A0A4R2J6E0_9PSEU|nr:NAD(+)/NADH kinase [Actinocrispum wychmicini]TCO53607.1 NAD+ kinase [Actinocrispum wychmicini]
MGVIRAIGLVLHPQRNCVAVIETIAEWARARHTDVIGLADEVTTRANGLVRPVDTDDLAKRADLVVSLGGDGTMLRAFRLSVANRTPVLGVNLGRLGFLAEVDIPQLGDALSAIDDHRFTVENRSGLAAVINGEETIAFNDIALVRVPGHGMTEVLLHVEGHPFVDYAADAVVVATPTGSTAYNFAAGGPIVSPRAEGLLVTPAAPHSAFNRSLFLSSGEKLALEVLPSSGEVAVEADGRLIGTVAPGSMIDITALPGAARVVRLGRTTFYQRTQRKFRLTGSARPSEPDIEGLC